MTSRRPSRPAWANEVFDRLDHIEGKIKDVHDMAEPVASAYRDGRKMLAGAVVALTIVAAVISAWWTGAIAAVLKFLHDGPNS